MLLRPRFWGGHLLALLAVLAALGLAWWQYSAWQAQRAAEARDVSDATPVALSTLLGPDDPFPGDALGRPVTFNGTWMKPTLYVADRDLAGKTGYWVVTPVRVGSSAMPVVRGWSATATSEPATGNVVVAGWLQPGEGQGQPDDDPHDLIIPSMRIGSMTQEIDRDLYSGFVVNKVPSAGLKAVPPDAIPPISSLTALRNLLYAIQWIIFGGLAVVVWRRWCLDHIDAARGVAEETDEEPEDPA